MNKKENDRNQIDMIHGPLLKRMVLFALPLMASSILQLLFTMTDTAVVGQFAGPQAMAAVGGNSPVINLLVSLFVGISVGANVVIARLIGENRKDRLSSAIYTCVVLAVASGLLLCVIGEVFAETLLRITGVPDDIMDLARLYLRIYFCATPFITVYNFCASILRSKGDSRRPLYILIASGFINVGLNLVFVIVFHMSVAGVALATMIANVFSSAVILWMMAREEEPFRLHIRGMKLDKQIIRDVIRIGIPAGVQGMVFSLSNTVIQSGINSLGSTCVAGNAAALNFEGIGFFALNSFSQATVTFTSQNYGAQQAERCKRIWRIGMICGFFACLVVNVGCMLFQDPLLLLFTKSPEVIAIGKIRMSHVLVFQSLAALYEVSGSSLRGMGYSMTPAVMTIFGTCIVRIFWTIAVFPQFGTLDVLLFIYPVSWLLTNVLIQIAFFIVTRREYKKMALSGQG